MVMTSVTERIIRQAQQRGFRIRTSTAGGRTIHLVDQHGHCIVVGHVALVIEQPVLPVAGIGIERDIGEHADVAAAGVLDRPNRAAHEVVGVERLFPALAAKRRGRVREQGDAGDAERPRLPRPLADPIPYRGALGLRTLPDDVVERIWAAVAA